MHSPAPQTCAEHDHADLGKRGTSTWAKKRMASYWLWWTKSARDMQFYVGRQLLDHVPFRGALGKDDEGSDSGSGEMGFGSQTSESTMDKQAHKLPRRRRT